MTTDTPATLMKAAAAQTVHEFIDDSHRLTRCGKRRQFRHAVWPGRADEVTCSTCKTLAKTDSRRPWRSR